MKISMFQIGQVVKLIRSEHIGKITARAEYIDSIANYFVSSFSGDGTNDKKWWDESELEAIDESAGS